MRSYITFLISRSSELAYYTWLQFLPPEQLPNTGYLFNGGFQSKPSGLPFDRILPSGNGVTADIQDRFDQVGDRALSIEFGYGRVEFPGVSQVTMLTPGQYAFRGKFQGNISARRGLKWHIACADTPLKQSVRAEWCWEARPTGETSISSSKSETGCQAQVVKLIHDARSQSERFISGQINMTNLRVTRRL